MATRQGATSSLLANPLDEEPIDDGVIDEVVFSAVGGRDRHFRGDWTELTEAGASDDEIADLIQRVWDRTAGEDLASSWVHLTPHSAQSYTRGVIPGTSTWAIWVGWHVAIDGTDGMPEPTYAGESLIEAVRRIARIPLSKPARVVLYDEAADEAARAALEATPAEGECHTDAFERTREAIRNARQVSKTRTVKAGRKRKSLAKSSQGRN